MEPLWHIELFGHLCARHGKQEITRFRTHKTASLLAYLGCHLQQTHAREVLIELFWPEVPIEDGRNNLSVSLNSLRKQLEPPGIPAGTVLITDRTHARLNPATVCTDVAAFEAAAQSMPAEETAQERAERLIPAVELYRGELLPGYYEDWVLAERDRLADLYRSALRPLIQCLAQTRQSERAIVYAHRAIQTDPLREQGHRDLMRLYVAVGRPAAALEQVRELEDLLKKTFGAAPSTATRELAAQIAAQAGAVATSSVVIPPTPTPVPEAPPVPAAPQAASPPPPARSRLPIQFTRFFGREPERERIEALLRSSECRLLTLTGPGGAGKTRLAIEAAVRLQQAFVGRVWFVPLAEVTEAERLGDAIYDVLELPSSAELTPMEQIARQFVEEPALLVLDNLEHLGVAGAQAVAQLLERSAALRVLATSRQPLELAGERELAILPLETPRSVGAPERLLEFPSVQLFVDRAQARQVDFQITRQNAASIAALCERLEGIPLAIELAASWAKLLTPQQMLAQLTQRFEFLVSRRADLPERHRTLRAAIESSYRLLSTDLQRCFARLSVFRGGWTLEAAQAVCEQPDALILLAQLQNASLIGADETDEPNAETMRYRMLETLREFAAEQLSPQEAEEARRRHAVFLHQQVQVGVRGLRGPEVGSWLSRLTVEQDNIRAALEWTLGHQQDMALEMAGWLQRYWSMASRFSEGRYWLGRVLRRCPDGPAELRAAVLNGLAMLAMYQGDSEEARGFYEACLALFREMDHKRGISSALNNLGILARMQGNYAEAQVLLEESLGIDRELGDTWGVAASLNNLGNLGCNRLDFQASQRYFAESLALRRALGDQNGIAWSLCNLAATAIHLGQYSIAQDYLEESLALMRAIKDRRGEARVFSNLAVWACKQDSWETAAQYAGQCLDLILEVEEWPLSSGILANCAYIARARRQFARAARLIGAAEALAARLGIQFPELPDRAEYERGWAELQRTLGDATFASEKAVGASLSLEQAFALAREPVLPGTEVPVSPLPGASADAP
jgi:predicted ATPase/DNA-binding SARP family transcriptional activator